MDVDKSREKSGAIAQPNRTTPTAAIRFIRAVLGSVNHHASTAERMSRVGTSDVHEVHDISVRSIGGGERECRGFQRFCRTVLRHTRNGRSKGRRG